MGCAAYTSNGCTGCNFFKWIDGVFNAQAEATIAKLVKQKKELEARNMLLEEKLKVKEREQLRIAYLSRITLFVVVVILGFLALKT